jgi:hypothetical protein
MAKKIRRGVPRMRSQRAVTVALLAMMLLLAAFASVAQAPVIRSQPPNVRRELFRGVMYVRQARSKPRPLVVHVLIVNLRDRDVRFVVTPEERMEGGRVRARTTSGFLHEFRLQAAVNASNFTTTAAMPGGTYPGAGYPATPDGTWASEGSIFARGDDVRWPAIYISQDNHVTFEAPATGAYNALAGKGTIITRGATTVGDAPVNHALHPRTAVAVDRSGRRLILLVVDGRQPLYSEGVTVAELADIARKFGAYTGINSTEVGLPQW